MRITTLCLGAVVLLAPAAAAQDVTVERDGDEVAITRPDGTVERFTIDEAAALRVRSKNGPLVVEREDGAGPSGGRHFEFQGEDGPRAFAFHLRPEDAPFRFEDFGFEDFDAMLREATRLSFDRIDSDGAMSTSDTVTLLASGASGRNAGFLMRTALDAQVASETIRKAVQATPLVPYPANALARQLAMVGAMIRAGLKTRVYYASLGGFDTHAGQGGPQGAHANLLEQLGSAVKAFYDDLKAQENADRVLTMTFSEFGRRVSQNASQGTDHGAAAPMFLAGPMVRPGVLNSHPSLTDLDRGDLKHRVDFRSVYSGILEDWLKADPVAVLGARFQPARLIRG